jgi:hypothetical protein
MTNLEQWVYSSHANIYLAKRDRFTCLKWIALKIDPGVRIQKAPKKAMTFIEVMLTRMYYELLVQSDERRALNERRSSGIPCHRP